MWLPLVKIRLPSAHMTGFAELTEVQPEIPQGTVVHLKNDSYEIPRLAPSEDAALDSGVSLGSYATASVIRFDPASGDRDLYVRVTSGRFAGHVGWIFSLDAEDEDGHPINLFDDAVMTAPKPPKIDRMAKLYVIKRSLRAFKQISVCQAARFAMSSDKAFAELEVAYAEHQYYDFPAGTQLHVVSDSGPDSPYIMVGDSHGHHGCVSRFALPGYEPP